MHSFELGGDKKTKGAALTFVCPFLMLSDCRKILIDALTVNAEPVVHLELCYATCVLTYYTNMLRPCQENIFAFAQT